MFSSTADLLQGYLNPSSHLAPVAYKKEYVFISTASSKFSSFKSESDFVVSLDRPLNKVVKTDLVQYSFESEVSTLAPVCVQSRALGNDMITSGSSPSFWRLLNNATVSTNSLVSLSRVDNYFDAPRDIREIDIRITNDLGTPVVLGSVMMVIEIIRVVSEPAAQTF